jgi:hypothetical protein
MGAQYSECLLYLELIKPNINNTLNSLLFSETLLDSSPTYQILRYSPDVANKSLCVPAYIININFSKSITRSGIHIIFVGGYS